MTGPLIQPAAANNRLQQVYGTDFPGLVNDGSKWRTWIDAEIRKQRQPMQDRRYHFQRHDSFRKGDQWLSSRDGRSLREPKADKNSLRLTENIIGPALDFRLGIVAEQRAGFRMEPITSSTMARETAEAQQAFAEYYYYVQRAWGMFLDAAFWAQTHGVAFVHVYVDQYSGPSHEDVELIPQTDERYKALAALGYEQGEGGNIIVPLDETGNYAAPGTAVREIHEGDLCSRVVLANETLADPEARFVNGPYDTARWFMSRRQRDLRAVRLETGMQDLQAESMMTTDDFAYDPAAAAGYQRGLPPFPGKRTTFYKEGVIDHYIYLAPNKNALPEGGWARIVGSKVVQLEEELPGGVIPFARFTDGSSDPQLYPRPVVSDWLPDQTAVNMIKTQLAQYARFLGGGRVMARKGSVLSETYSTIVGSLLEYDGQPPQFVTATGAGKDLYEQYAQWKKSLEDKTGWTDPARGQVTGEGSMQDVSGRAMLAARETFERTLGPFVRGIADGATEWANLTVQIGKYIITTPRVIPSVGRPDLALRITRESLGDGSRALVYADPETMIPMPHAMRAQLLEDQLDKGRITLAQYQQRQPYADIRNLTMGDTQQWERAQWINTEIEERYEELAQQEPIMLYGATNGFMVLYTDTPSLHKKALQEIILDERKPFAMRKLAIDRWGIYDQLERAQLDATGQIPIPFEVIGTPPDKVAMQQPAPMPSAAAPMPMQAGAAPGAVAPAAPMTSAAPSLSSTVPPAAAMDTAQPLGTMGAAEQVPQSDQLAA